MSELTPEQQKELEEKIKKMSPEELKEFQKQQCIFCQIVAGKVPAKQVYSDDLCIAVLDINPAAPGHLLIMPKEHYAIMPQVPDTVQAHLFLVVKYLSQMMLKVLKVNGTTTFIANGFTAGQRAQHFMLHLIPRKEGDGLLPMGEKLIAAELQQKIRQVVEQRLNELLGIKKAEMPKNETPLERLPERKVETEEKPTPREQEEVAEKEKPATAKKSRKKKTEEKSNEGASLDDIARLFT